ncbi:MAG: deoxyhypusine synthase [Desulfurococcales archaeon]|nr:deoxyhypusine synthase [Desulfurococcales archaeon]
MNTYNEIGERLVTDITIPKDFNCSKIKEIYGSIYGFMAGHLYEAMKFFEENPPPDVRALSFTANLVSTGLRGVFAQLIREKVFNVVFTTCGTLDHDIARAMGGRYLKGSFSLDDEELYEQGYHRLGNIVIPISDYGPLVEKFVFDLTEKLPEREKAWPLYQLLWEAGKMINDENSILRAAYETRTPIFVPGWPDGAFGTNIFMANQAGKNIRIDYFNDMKKLSEIFFTQEKKGFALIVGGGISKHHTIWWSQFMGGLDSAIYVTTAVEYDGSLSGAHPREAVSWGKIKPRSKRIIIYSDATLTLPLIACSALQNWGKKPNQ